MNILYHHRTRGGDVEGVHIRGIVHALRDLGHRVDIISPPGVSVEASASPSAGPTAPMSVAGEQAAPPRKTRRSSPWALVAEHAPEGLFEQAELAYNAYAYPAIEAALHRRRYDFIYERYALFSVAGVWAARRNGVPLLLEVNDSADVNRIRKLHMQAAARHAERYILGAATAVLTVTTYFRDLLVEAGAPADRVHVIPNGVDASALAIPSGTSALRERLGLGGSTVIGYVGAINFWRRIDLLVEAFAALAKRRPDVRLLLIGDGPDRAAVAERARALGLADRVVQTGRLPHAEVQQYLHAVDIAVLPHSNVYGSPMKLFEYMAAGRPVVAPWLPPVVSVLGEGGVLFRPLDGHGLEQALEGLCSDPALRLRMGERARASVSERYLWRHHAERILAIHAGLAAGSLGARA